MKSTSLHDTVSTVLLVIGGVIVAALVVMFLFRATNSQLETGNKALNQTEIQNQQLLESKITQFDGAEVTGSMVCNVFKTFACEKLKIKITVDTPGFSYECQNGIDGLKNSDGQYKFNDRTGSEYINPSTLYTGSVVRTNGEITDLNFKIRN